MRMQEKKRMIDNYEAQLQETQQHEVEKNRLLSESQLHASARAEKALRR